MTAVSLVDKRIIINTAILMVKKHGWDSINARSLAKELGMSTKPLYRIYSGMEEIKLGSLTPTRDFNFVKDTAAGFIAIAESDKTIGEEINIATQQEISIGDLANEIISQINPKARIICDEQRLRPEKSEVNRLLGSNEKIKRLTDWEPKYTFADGIRETISWMRGNLGNYKSDIYNV